jgi:hypothetical protein
MDDRLFAKQLPSEDETIIRDVIAILIGKEKRGKGVKKDDIQEAVVKQFGDSIQFDFGTFDKLLGEMCKISGGNICKLKPMFK